MNLYEIDQAILSLVDAETGEILDYEAFAELQMERDQKIENVALWIKNLVAEAAALKAEKDSFAEREKAAKNKAESLKKYLDTILQGQPLKTTKFNVTYRKSEATVIDDISKIPAEYLKPIDPEADKTAIKNAIKAGAEIAGAHIEEKMNISIK
jgi:outer membrane murein-binding lipoprotein Lpp